MGVVEPELSGALGSPTCICKLIPVNTCSAAIYDRSPRTHCTATRFGLVHSAFSMQLLIMNQRITDQAAADLGVLRISATVTGN